MQRGIVVPILGLALVAWLGGCVADSGDGGILVLRNLQAGTTCVGAGSETAVGISQGSLDLLIPSRYVFIAQMKSRITAIAGQEDQRTIIISGANVDIEFPGSTLFSAAELAELQAMALTRRKAPFTAPLLPNGGISNVPFELIPEELTRRIAAKVADSTRIQAVATFTVEGDMSGQSVKSQPFSFAITVGRGVVINVAGACPLPRDFGTLRTGYICNPYQDQIVDCCGTDEDPRCPAILAPM